MHISFMITRLVTLIARILEVLLLIRFFAKLFSANPNHNLVVILYKITEPIIIPFREILPPYSIARFDVEWASLIAAAVVAVLGFVLVRILEFLFKK